MRRDYLKEELKKFKWPDKAPKKPKRSDDHIIDYYPFKSEQKDAEKGAL